MEKFFGWLSFIAAVVGIVGLFDNFLGGVIWIGISIILGFIGYKFSK